MAAGSFLLEWWKEEAAIQLTQSMAADVGRLALIVARLEQGPMLLIVGTLKIVAWSQNNAVTDSWQPSSLRRCHSM